MASLFSGKSKSERSSGACNGGLGGLRPLDTLVYNDYASKQRFSMMRKKKPPPISVSVGDSDISFTTMTPTSIILHDFRTPSNPSTPRVLSKVGFEEHNGFLTSVPLSPRVTVTELPESRQTVPPTPTTPVPNDSGPVELPGSLLLPNKGYPQLLPPSTPTRSSLDHNSDDTLIGSPPDLTPSSSSTDNNMDLQMLKAFAAKKKDVENIGKPFSAMNSDELLQVLPSLPAKVVPISWIPAMADHIKALFQTAAEKRETSETVLSSFTDHIKSIDNVSQDIRDRYYELTQVLIPALQEEREQNRMEIESANAESQKAGWLIQTKTKQLEDLRAYHDDAVGALILFLRMHVGNLLDRQNDPLTTDINSIILGHSSSIEDCRTSTGKAYAQVLAEDQERGLLQLAELETRVQYLQEHMHEQLKVIKSQNKDLDKLADRLAGKVEIIKELNATVGHLAERLDQQAKISSTRVADNQDLEQRHAALTGTYESLQEDYQIQRAGYEQQLRGQARELKMKDDEIKRLEGHIQALMSNGHHSRLKRPPFITDREVRHTGRSLQIPGHDTSIRPALPSSQSSLGLSHIASASKPTEKRLPSPRREAGVGKLFTGESSLRSKYSPRPMDKELPSTPNNGHAFPIHEVEGDNLRDEASVESYGSENDIFMESQEQSKGGEFPLTGSSAARQRDPVNTLQQEAWYKRVVRSKTETSLVQIL